MGTPRSQESGIFVAPHDWIALLDLTQEHPFQRQARFVATEKSVHEPHVLIDTVFPTTGSRLSRSNRSNTARCPSMLQR